MRPRVRAPTYSATAARIRRRGPAGQPVAPEHADDRLDVVVVDRLAAVGDHVTLMAMRARRISCQPQVVRVRPVREARRNRPRLLGSVNHHSAGPGLDDVAVVLPRGAELSSAEIISSCSFSPGRIPMSTGGYPGAMASMRSVIRMLGMRGTNSLAALHAVEGVDDELDSLLERDPEPGHPRSVTGSGSPVRMRASGRTG